MKTYVDLQVNGWKGINFSDPGLTLDDIRRVTRDLLAKGTVAYCPTLITSPLPVYRRNLPLLAQAMLQPDLAPHLLGIHLEGPFISPRPGARGAHPEAHVRRPSLHLLDQLVNWAGGRVSILTLAPEAPNAPALIRHAARQGITVSLGHHVADDESIRNAVRAGARAATHVGNGIPNELPRHPNPLWFQLACDDLSCLFITDGHHLPEPFIRVALRAKGPERFIVTSDASPLAGMPPGRYPVFGLIAVINRAGRVYSEHHHGLVGSHATMAECIRHLESLRLLTHSDLRRVGALNALRLIGLDARRLELATHHRRFSR